MYTVEPLKHEMYGQSYGTDWQLLDGDNVIAVFYSEDTAQAAADALNRYGLERDGEAVSSGTA